MLLKKEDMNKIPKVSIIVPIYNVEKYLDRCIQSLVNQTLNDIEIILVDDGSPDNCPSMCDEYAQKDNRIKVIHKQNAGLGYARNSGLDIATGEYVAFVDSDDYVDTTMYENLYNAAINYNVDTVFSNYYIVDQYNRVAQIHQQETIQFYMGNDIKQNMLLNMIASDVNISKERQIDMSVWRAIYSKEIIDKNQIKFETERKFISEDIIFHIDYCSHSQAVCLLPEAYYYYTVNFNSLTKKVRTDRFQMDKILHKEIIRRCNNNGITENVTQRADRFFIGYVRTDIRNLCKASLPFFVKRNIILNICKDNYWNDIYKRYPIRMMPFTHKIFLLCIKYNFFSFLYLMTKVKG